MASGEDFDSGMESQDNSAKEVSPDKKLEIEGDIDEEVNIRLKCTHANKMG